jgi:hypothetical protein
MTWDPLRVGQGTPLNPAALLAVAFHSGIGSMTWNLLYRIRDTRGPIDIPLGALPLLVRFRDLNDPTTVERVDPFDLAGSFGAGVKIKRATIEITNAPVTTGIEQKLPWLALPYPEQRKLFGILQWGGPGSDRPVTRVLFPYFFETKDDSR